MFTPTHRFHGIAVEIVKRNDDGSIRVRSYDRGPNLHNMGPGQLKELTVLDASWLEEIDPEPLAVRQAREWAGEGYAAYIAQLIRDRVSAGHWTPEFAAGDLAPMLAGNDGA